MNKATKIRQYIRFALFWLCFLVLLGIAGATDNGKHLSVGLIAITSATILAMFLLALLMAATEYYYNEQEDRK